MFRKVTLLEISKRPLLMVLAGLQYIVCNAARSKYLTKFLKGVLKLPKKWSLIWFLIRNTQTYKQQLSTLRVFKTPEIRSMTEFPSSEAGTNDVSTE